MSDHDPSHHGVACGWVCPAHAQEAPRDRRLTFLAGQFGLDMIQVYCIPHEREALLAWDGTRLLPGCCAAEALLAAT